MDPVIVWFVLGLLLVLLELVLPGIILIFFGIGAWMVALFTWLGITSSLESQLAIFAISSLLLLLGLRRWISSQLHGHVSNRQDLAVDLDEFTGRNVTVVIDIQPGKTDGRVEFKGSNWHAVSDQSLVAGDVAVIVSADGLTLKVAKA